MSSLGLLYLIYAYRISQLKKQQKIRKDIAADLHDDIGCILQSVINFTHLAKKEPHKQEYLSRIEDSIIQAVAGFRGVIWILDDKQDSIYQFMERVKKFAFPLTISNNVQLSCSVDPEINNKTFSKA